jgi:glycosyltransferase involved in cell wall biosynthesis
MSIEELEITKNWNRNIQHPLVSIACITFNQASYIQEAINGFLMQITNFPFEIIIGEDCSTDNTVIILEENKVNFSNIIQYFSSSTNVGPLENLTTTLKRCSGKYIAFCEGDDFWIDPYKLQKQVDFLESNNDYGLVWTDVNFFKQSTLTNVNSVFDRKILKVFDSFENTLINKPYFSPPTWLFRRIFIENTEDYANKKYSDGSLPFILDVLAVSKIKYLNNVTATYRQLDESASNSKIMKKRYEFSKGVYRIQKDYLSKYTHYGYLEKLIDYQHHLSAFPYALIVGDSNGVDQGIKVLRESNDLLAKIFLFMSKSSFGVKLITFIYEKAILKQVLSKLFK